jgi:aryl-alcohol dehydrogenase-like predicted oxidoreductase
MMESRQLGRSGFKVPALCLGTGTFGGGTEFFKAWGASDVAGATRLVDVCLEAGLTMFDSADIYSDGLAEEILGKAIKGRRERVILSTKGGQRAGAGPNDVGSCRQHLIAACEGSLRRLGTDTIDLYQIHAFDALTPVEETLHALDHLVQAGKVRCVGCWARVRVGADAAGARSRDRHAGLEPVLAVLQRRPTRGRRSAFPLDGSIY